MDQEYEEVARLSFKHYREWIDLENEIDSPDRWLYGAFGVVKGLIRIPFENGEEDYGRELLGMLHDYLDEFEKSLAAKKNK